MDMETGCVCIPHIGAWAIRECEQGGGPKRLVVVASGRVTAVSAAARADGVEHGMTIARVQTLCPEVSIRPRDPAMEAAAWQRVETRLNRATPYVETEQPGRAFVRPHEIPALARAVNDLGAHAALAPGRSVAHLAAEKALPGELLQIQPDRVPGFLRRLPVHALTAAGMSEEIPEQLALFGYNTVHAVRALSKRHLTAQFGDDGKRLYAFLHENDRPVAAYVPPPSIEAHHAFEHDQTEPGAVEAALASLLDTAAEQLDGRTTRRLAVHLQDRDAPRRIAARTLREPRHGGDLATIADTLLHTIVHDGMHVSAVGIRLSALATPTGRQGRLFHQRPGVRKAVEAVEQRYPGAVRRAVTQAAAIFDEDRYDFVPVAATR